MADHDWAQTQRRFRDALDAAELNRLARELGVTVASLDRLEVGWSARDRAWTFPELNATGAVTAINRRYADGTKKVIHGGHRGLYLPVGWRKMPGPLLVPEGASDVAALLSVGLPAIGRPSASGGVDLLADLLADDDREIVIVGENDEKPDKRWPGREGAKTTAQKLADRLQRAVKWTLPPEGAKDVREWIHRTLEEHDRAEAAQARRRDKQEGKGHGRRPARREAKKANRPRTAEASPRRGGGGRAGSGRGRR